MHSFILDWFYHVLGIQGFGPFYGFFSGSEADLTQLTILGGVAAVYRKHTCEVHGCWRLGRHKTAAEHCVCRKHHPYDKLTPETIIEAHNKAIERRDSV